MAKTYKDKKGYVCFSNSGKKRSRWVLEKLFSGKLGPGRVVHHKNRVKDDDRPENLRAMDRKKHLKMHRRFGW